MKHLLRWASAGLIFIGGLPQDAIAQDSAAANAPPPASGQAQQAYSHEELDAMLAPIALYPDDLVTQLLMASTYPLDIVAASRWLSEDDHKSLKGTALEAALKPLPWDPSVKSLVPFPVVLETMNQHLDWTQKLGYAMTVQQSDVFTSVQRLRAKAQASGHLQSNEQMTVSAEGPPAGAPPPPEGAPAQNIIIEPANPEVVYVPQYDPTVVYGDWGYSTPPYYYPPPPAYYGYYPGYYPGAALAAGFLWGAGWAIAGGLWGWARPGWGWGGGVYNNININANRYSNIGGGRWNGGGRWQGGNVGRPGGIGSAGRPGGVGGVGRPGGVGGVGGAGRPGGVGGVGGAGRPGGVGGAGGAGRPGGVGGAGRPGGVGGAGRPGGVGSAGRPGGAGQYGGRGGQYGGARGGQYGGARGSYGGSYGGARGSHGGSRGGYGARGGGHGGGARGGGSRGGGGRGGGGRGGGGRGGGRR